MKPFIPSDLEIHMILNHGVSPELLSDNREFNVNYTQVVEYSHEIMHRIGGDAVRTEHTHEDDPASA